MWLSLVFPETQCKVERPDTVINLFFITEVFDAH